MFLRSHLNVHGVCSKTLLGLFAPLLGRTVAYTAVIRGAEVGVGEEGLVQLGVPRVEHKGVDHGERLSRPASDDVIISIVERSVSIKPASTPPPPRLPPRQRPRAHGIGCQGRAGVHCYGLVQRNHVACPADAEPCGLPVVPFHHIPPHPALAVNRPWPPCRRAVQSSPWSWRTTGRTHARTHASTPTASASTSVV